MRHFSNVTAILLTITTAAGAGCASAAGAVALQRPAVVLTSIGDVRLPPGTHCVVQLTSGDVVRGRFARVVGESVELEVEQPDGPAAPRTFAVADVEVIAKMVTMSRVRRGWIGAAIVAAASVPFGISMVGDMVVPAAITGGLVGYHSGEPRAEIVYERRRVPR
jgi:hypothetical protein